MRMKARSTAGLSLASAGLLYFLAAAAAGQEGQEYWARVLRENENLVQSGHAVVSETQSPTDPAVAEQVKAMSYWEEGGLSFVNYYVSKEEAEARAETYEWWRSGAKERVNYLPKAGAAQGAYPQGFKHADAFDGALVRSLEYSADGPMGAISPAEGNWNGMVTDRPLNFIFLFTEKQHYCDLVADARDYRESTITRDGKTCRQIESTHPTIKGRRFVLIFDEENRFVERQLLINWVSGDDGTLFMNYRHVLGDYELMTLPDGGTIWFPRRMDVHYYAPGKSGGAPVEFTTKTIRIKEFALNAEVPDDVFRLEFPPGTQVWDNVSGAGNVNETMKVDRVEGLEPEEIIEGAEQAEGVESTETAAEKSEATPAAPVVEEARGGARRYWGAGVVVAVLLVAAVVARIRRGAGRKASS